MISSNHISESELTAYIDGHLDRPDRERIAGHLTWCKTCRREFNELSLGRLAMHALPAPPVPEGIWGRIDEDLDIRPPRRHISIRSGGIAIAASILLIGLLVTLFTGPDLWNGDDNGTIRPSLAGVAPFDWGIFLYDLDHPDFIQRLGRAYLIRDVSFDEAINLAGISDLEALNRLDDVLEFVSARVLENGESRAGILKYMGEPGTVYILVQPRNDAVSFAGFSVEMDIIRDQPCYSVYCTRFRALSFISGGTTYTVVASRASDKIAELVSIVSGSLIG